MGKRKMRKRHTLKNELTVFMLLESVVTLMRSHSSLLCLFLIFFQKYAGRYRICA